MIGVFDSGFGGLTILKYFFKDLGEYDYVYFGDSARAPYGSRSQDVIYEYTKEAVDFLFSEGCELIILACNSASSQALRKIQQEYLPEKYPDKRVLGVIRPLVERIAEGENKVVGVVGTRATVESSIYKKELEALNPEICIFEKSAPLLVPLIEEGWIKNKETKMILKKYLRPLKERKIESLILGCTHYPVLYKDIKKIMPKKCEILNSGEIVSKSLRKYLNAHAEIKGKISKNGKRIFFTSDSVEKFSKMGEKFLGQKIEKVKRVKI